jgi:hypothetical protein
LGTGFGETVFVDCEIHHAAYVSRK